MNFRHNSRSAQFQCIYDTAAPLDHRETSDRYHGELFRDGDYRVVVCRNGFQWIIQRATRAGSPAGPRWIGEHYVTTQKALVRLWPGSDPAGRLFVDSLPRHIKFWDAAAV